MLLVVLKVIRNVFAVQQPASLGLLNEPVVNWTPAGVHMHNGAGAGPVGEFPESPVAPDQLEDFSVGPLSGREGADDLDVAHGIQLS